MISGLRIGRDWLRLVRVHRYLIWELARQELKDRYTGQALGAIWFVAYPLIQIGVYLFVFQVVFKIRVGNGSGIPSDYAVYLLSGLIPWLALQETMAKSTSLVSANANLAKQMVFPLEVLPIKAVMVAVATQLVAFSLLLAYVGIVHQRIFWTCALLPGLIALQMCGMLGVAYCLAAVGTFLRDLREVVAVISLVGLYLLPVFYLPEMVPAKLRPVLYLNPFSYTVWCYQDVLYFGTITRPIAWIVTSLGSLLLLVFGYALFQRLKTFFGHVL